MTIKKLAAAAAVLLALLRPAAAMPPLPAAEEARVETLLKSMTLEEKAGQMTQLTLSYFYDEKAEAGAVKAVDQAKLEDAVVAHHVGVLLTDNSHLPAESWRAIFARLQAVALEKTRLKIPLLIGFDAMHGANYTDGAVLFPKELSLAATRDEEGVRRAYEQTARQTRATGIPWNYAPVLDVGRQPLWARFDETFGEDTYLATRLGAAAVRGMQGEDPSAPDRVGVSLKHYVGYSFPWSGQDRTPAYMDERTLREIYLPPFEAAVKAGALTVMVNSSQLNGIPGHANRRLLTEILKGELGFEGLVISDWGDIKSLHERDRVAATPEDAVALAVNAGVDVSMVPSDLSFPTLLIAAVRDGKVPQERVDDAVRRILRVKARLGLFKRPNSGKGLGVAGPAAEVLSRRLADESLVLLKNDGVLPLKKGAHILVAGPAADSRQALNGGWTMTWQGDDEKAYPLSWPTVWEALRRDGGPNVSFSGGEEFSAPFDPSAALAASKGADAVVLVLGEKAYAETPGNIGSLLLDESQRNLAVSLEKSGVPVVLVLAEGRPRVLGDAAVGARAILFAGRPGPYGGDAVARALFGDANPSGRLPFSYPRAPNALTPYDRVQSEDMGGNKYDPLFPFGAGLGYSRLRYEDLRVEPASLPPGGSASVSVRVVNDGPRDAEDAVELYASQLYSSVSPSVRRLKAFRRVKLRAGEARTVTFALAESDLSIVGVDLKRRTEPGAFDVFVGSLTARLQAGGVRPSAAP